MLRQIQCDAFVDKQPIVFGLGLNIVQGYSGNSIGKTSLLKIVDYAFGGTYYSQSNKDIIKYIGHHTIKFTHIFNGKEYNFSRYTGRPNTVYVCNDEFNIIETISLNAFNKMLSLSTNPPLFPGVGLWYNGKKKRRKRRWDPC